MNTVAKLVICGAALALTGGCALMELAENPHPWPSERRLLAKDWVVPQVAVDEEPVYCYRTLGVVDCYGEPLDESEAGRLAGADESGKPGPSVFQRILP